MTLRNTSTIHLQDVEIQFDFPTEDVEAWASRPSLSRTALLSVDASITDPWKKAFRWRIPYLPSTDSVEFSFRAVDPSSDDYEVALYKADRVIVQKSKGEPTSKGMAEWPARLAAVAAAFVAVTLGSGIVGISAVLRSPGTQSSTFNEAGCVLTVGSRLQSDSRDVYTWPWGSQGPWEIHDSVLNIGTQRCVVQLDGQQAVTLEPGGVKIRESYSISRPQHAARGLAFGPDSPLHRVQAQFYAEHD